MQLGDEGERFFRQNFVEAGTARRANGNAAKTDRTRFYGSLFLRGCLCLCADSLFGGLFRGFRLGLLLRGAGGFGLALTL
jgi:hypothetical protein